MKQILWKFMFPSQRICIERAIRRNESLRQRGFSGLRRILLTRLQRTHGVFIHPNSVVPASTRFPHPVNIVIGDGAKLGVGVTVYQGVTIGSSGKDDTYPSIGNGVIIFAGAVIIGGVDIGDGAIIGANAVVVGDIPAQSTAVGVPAKVIGRQNV